MADPEGKKESTPTPATDLKEGETVIASRETDEGTIVVTSEGRKFLRPKSSEAKRGPGRPPKSGT